MAGLGAGFAGLLGNNVLQQVFLYTVGGQIIGAGLAPYMTQLQQLSFQFDPAVALTPAELAEAVLRTAMNHDDAVSEAAMSGLNSYRFGILEKLAGNAPAPQELAAALRRKLIDRARYDLGIAQGRTRNEWGELYTQLAVAQPSPEAMLQAYLEGQIGEAEARQRFAQLGGDPAYFDILFHTQGQAPSPPEALELANRGIIPWDGSGPDVTSYEQAFLEGPWRNKWLRPFRALGEYLPPPRTVTAMLRAGSLSVERGSELLRKQGLAPDLVAAYVADATAQSTSSTKDLGQSLVTTLYRDRLVSRDQAAGFLQALGYDATAANYILEVEDLRVVQSFMSSAVSRVHTLYVGHKISQATASSTLAEVGVPAAGIPDLIDLWSSERDANVRSLTPAEVAAAFKKTLISQADAMTYLGQLGYLPHDAWLYLAIHATVAANSEPPRGATSPTGG